LPSPQPSLTAARAAELIAERCFTATPAKGARIGLEIEWLTYPHGDAAARPGLSALETAVASAGPLADGGRVTFEPGGQVEISTAPASGVDAACGAAACGAHALVESLDAAGVGLLALGLDPNRAPRRITTAPRYAAMEAYFDRIGPAGREMMCGTAAIQVNLDLGSPSERLHRWHVAHVVGPVLTAAFANSPFARGRPTGYRSTRMAVWAVLDPDRTTPVNGDRRDHDPAATWARYALRAPVMLVRDELDSYRPLLRHLPFGRWLDGDDEAGFPTEGDLAYHLTTLFPPVRPRGWLELRMVDALPDPWWRVAVAVTSALVSDEAASAVAVEATAASTGSWADAARRGLSHPGIAAAASRCFAAAVDALPRVGAGPLTRAACESYMELYVERGRCPADDLLDAWARDGALPAVPRPEAGRPAEEAHSWT